MRNIAPGMSPAKIAIVVAATIAPSAGTGGMKNVTGTSSAVAIVAVSPGMAPTKMPNTDAPRMTVSTYGSKTSPKAVIRACIQPPDTSDMNHPRGNGMRITVPKNQWMTSDDTTPVSSAPRRARPSTTPTPRR